MYLTMGERFKPQKYYSEKMVTPKAKPIQITSIQRSGVLLYFKTYFYNYLLTIEFILLLNDYFQWWNGSDMFVIVVVFLFIPPCSWLYKRLKHVGGYAVLCICWY
jgi:hypothetical protein